MDDYICHAMIRIFVLSFLFSFSFFSVSGQSGEVLGVFSVSSSSGADPTPTVVGKFNSTMGFTALSVDTGELLIVRQVYGGAHRRKVYEVTGVSGSSPLTLTLLLVSGTSGGPFPTGAQAICRPLTSGVALDVPNVSQQLESYIINYSFSILEGLAI